MGTDTWCIQLHNADALSRLVLPQAGPTKDAPKPAEMISQMEYLRHIASIECSNQNIDKMHSDSLKSKK